jgi:hypothetical protein
MMSSLIWILACPLGMFAMGGVVWVASRLPGRRAERLARVSSRATCMSMGAKQQPAEVKESAPDSSAERKVAGHV